MRFVFHCVTAVHGWSGWEVSYARRSICAVKGWTVNIRCNYKIPAGETVQKVFWIKQKQEDTSGTVKNTITTSSRFNDTCNSKTCTLSIKRITESDSAVYKLKFLTNCHTGPYTGEPGVNLTVSSETHHNIINMS